MVAGTTGTFTSDLSGPGAATIALTFALAEQTGDATIGTGTIAIEVANGTALTALVPTITISPEATVNPDSGIAQDFSNPVIYTVTAEDGTSTQDWAITVTEAVLANTPLVINEIIMNPAAVDGDAGEWFELYSPGEQDVNINGWTIKDDDLDSHIISNGGPLFVPAAGNLVLGNNSDVGTNGGKIIGYEYEGYTLANTIDEVVLLDDTDNEMDRVDYDGSTFPNPQGVGYKIITQLYQGRGSSFKLLPLFNVPLIYSMLYLVDHFIPFLENSSTFYQLEKYSDRIWLNFNFCNTILPNLT